ncbi:MAG: 30S ribosomal protein S12 methylthiotransferase RimO, partial [Planctomycetota bacterium]|nr:30S ribosomal protein S12 methylthiotransferase RimO [Planctomycetota bacterium]
RGSPYTLRSVVSHKNLFTVALISLGCPKNLVDSERMLAGLALGGFAVTADADGADLAIVNTCAFIDLARAESDQHIDELETLKRAGRLGGIIVAGCMAQRYGREILGRHPTVDAIVGVSSRDALAEVCRKVVADRRAAQRAAGKTARRAKPHPLRGGSPYPPRKKCDAPPALVAVHPHAAAPPDDRERLRLTPRHYAYLRISEGCDNRCAYCAIPEIRGPLRSKPPEQVLAEAEELVADGAKELILIGQDTTAYGSDFAARLGPRGETIADCELRIADLKKQHARRDSQAVQSAIRNPQSAICSLGGLLAELRRRVQVPWLRVMYTHPASFGDDVIEQLAAGPPLVPYVDLPLQHVSDPILASMGRRTTRARIEKLVAKLRAAVPGIALRTSFIVGYPGETDAHFRELLAFLKKVRFDHVGVFMYSAEPGTRAAGLPKQVPAKVARRRWERMMTAAERLAFTSAKARVGRVLEVLVDGRDESGRLVARHAGQAPDVDGVVLLGAGAAEVGEFARVRITGAEGYDLIGKVE